MHFATRKSEASENPVYKLGLVGTALSEKPLWSRALTPWGASLPWGPPTHLESRKADPGACPFDCIRL